MATQKNKGVLTLKQELLMKEYYICNKLSRQTKTQPLINKAELYRKVYETSNMDANSANASFHYVLKKFNKLDEAILKEYCNKWDIDFERITIREEKQELENMQMYVKGKTDKIDGFIKSYEEGKEIGINSIKDKIGDLNLSTNRGRVQAQEYLFTLFVAELKDARISKETASFASSLVKALTDLTKLDKDDTENLKELVEMVDK